MAKEVKINLRLSMRVREVLNDEAEVEDTRIGTVANRLLQEELGRMMAVGAGHVFPAHGARVVEDEHDVGCHGLADHERRLGNVHSGLRKTRRQGQAGRKQQS